MVESHNLDSLSLNIEDVASLSHSAYLMQNYSVPQGTYLMGVVTRDSLLPQLELDIRRF